MIRIGIVSFWHVHAWDYTKQALAHAGAEVSAVWDEDPARGQEAADKLNVPFFSNLDEMLQYEALDGIIVTSPTNQHEEIMVKAAQAGKHIFTEKVVSTTLRGANQILDAVEQAGVKLTVSLPRLNDRYTLAIEQLLEKETLGQITLVRVRLSHNGATAEWLPEHFYNLEQCGGGALIDLGCHPMYLTRLFLGGLPTEVSTQYGYVTGKDVEDNAVSLLRGANGAIGIVEAGFVNAHSPFTIEVHGTKGTLLYGTPEEKLLVRSSALKQDEWQQVELPEQRESAFDQWIRHIEQNTVAEQNISLAKELTMLMEASNRSHHEKRAVSLAELER
ncbi:Gfo/Idh/MocA family protein [Paenibacillus sp. NPDC058071]|uniref:Gfo/Idh/MocA family protein n=1 Tax=Paenibacillus sp. NPDC058071 TaxID=3346326 RepID=UPI0036DE821E